MAQQTESQTTPRVTAVIVAYNRVQLLKESLDAIANQTIAPNAVVVVDNASEDGSGELAQFHPVVTQLIRLSANTGGAGGFTAGIAHALAAKDLGDHDYLWIMDDDTIPRPDALEKLLFAAADYCGSPALLASQAVWVDDQVHPMNAHRRRPFLNQASLLAATKIGARPVRAASFVSILIEVGQVRRVGLPVADYFIWNDDLEYTARLLKNRVGLYYPPSVVLHKTKALAGANTDPGERFFYEVRNKLWFLKLSPGLRVNDRVLYGGSMLVRWAKLFWKSADRKTLLRTFIKGVSEGVLGAPRCNEEVFAADQATQAAVLACEQAQWVRHSKPWAARLSNAQELKRAKELFQKKQVHK